MSGLFGASVGLETIQRAALLQLKNGLNDAIQAIEAEWTPLDQAYATAMGQTYVATTLETVPEGSFMEGHRPSLMEAPIEKYPNVSCMAYTAMPSTDQIDQADMFNDQLYIELMVKSQVFSSDADEVSAETIVNRRIQRMTDAVRRVISADLTLGGQSLALQDPPTINITDAFIRRFEKSRGDRWLWQGSRIEYTVTKYAEFY